MSAAKNTSRLAPMTSTPGPVPELDVDAMLDDKNQRIIVCCGAGGVGKTTTAAALALRDKYPDAQIIIAGDDDRQTEGNPGRTAANAAAVAVGGMVVFPEWPPGAPADLTDYNDLATWSRANEHA